MESSRVPFLAAGQRPQWGGTMSLLPGAMLYQGVGGDADGHAHYAIQMLASFDEPFTLELSGGEIRRTSVALIPSGQTHLLRCQSQRILLALVEPSGRRGRAMQFTAQHTEPGEIERRIVANLPKWGRSSRPGDIIRDFNRLLCPEVAAPNLRFSPSIEAAIQHIELALDANLRLEQVASRVHLSPSRLTHLFSREVGIPFRRYYLWVRLRRASESISKGLTITDAAAAGGFSDASHLSRVFRSNFGLSPSALFGMRCSPREWHGANGSQA